MRLKRSAIILSSILLITGSSSGQNFMSLDGASGTYGTSTDTIEVGQDVNLFIRWTQFNSPANVTDFSLGFKIYSYDGAQWNPASGGAYTGAITGGMINSTFINTFNLDGIGVDIVGFSGFAIFRPGIPNGFNAIVWWLSLGIIDASQACKTICIDSAFFPPAGVWQWGLSGGGILIPDWGGPYCFLIFNPANPCNGCCQFTGDVNHSGGAVPVDITDVLALVTYLFQGGATPECLNETDATGGCEGVGPDVVDLLTIVAYLFQGGDNLPPCHDCGW